MELKKHFTNSNRNSNSISKNLSFLTFLSKIQKTSQISLQNLSSFFTFFISTKSKASLPCSSPYYTHRLFHHFHLLRHCYVLTSLCTPRCSLFNRTFHLPSVCFNQKLTQEVSGIFRRIRIMKAIIQFSLLQAESPPPSLACPSFQYYEIDSQVIPIVFLTFST